MKKAARKLRTRRSRSRTISRHPSRRIAPQTPTVDPADISAWYAGKHFTSDWTSPRIEVWASLLHKRRAKVSAVLEIGCWEGRSSLFFLNYFPHCVATCIDTFEGSPELQRVPQWAQSVNGLERRFDGNVDAFKSRVEKIKAKSSDALGNLAIEGRRFDLIYVDGSHRAPDVFADGAVSWPMLRSGGIMIFDDYEWNMLPGKAEVPKAGIDAFLGLFTGQYRILHRGYQIILERTGTGRRRR